MQTRILTTIAQMESASYCSGHLIQKKIRRRAQAGFYYNLYPASFFFFVIFIYLLLCFQSAEASPWVIGSFQGTSWDLFLSGDLCYCALQIQLCGLGGVFSLQLGCLLKQLLLTCEPFHLLYNSEGPASHCKLPIIPNETFSCAGTSFDITGSNKRYAGCAFEIGLLVPHAVVWWWMMVPSLASIGRGLY